MKPMKRLYSILSAVAVAVVLWACGPAEVENTVTYNLEALCTVNKSRIEPEFSDSTYLFAKNVDQFGLETGDRAFLKMTCTYNLYSETEPLWTILDVVEKVPVYPLSADVDTAAFDTPITFLEPITFFDQFTALTWVWKGKQNISIVYNGVEESASYAMTVRGMNDGCVELDLFVSAKESTAEVKKLLTFDISNIADFLNDEEKAQLPSNLDDIKTRIYIRRMEGGSLKDSPLDGNYIR